MWCGDDKNQAAAAMPGYRRSLKIGIEPNSSRYSLCFSLCSSEVLAISIVPHVGNHTGKGAGCDSQVVNPPGGVWAAADEASGRVASAPIMSSRFPVRYKLFRCSNAAPVICSLMLIGMLLKHVGNQEPIIKKNTALVILAILCFLSFVVSCSVVFYMYVTSVNA
jgi:hypothetical protein